MNESVIKLVEAIRNGDAVATEEAFAAAMAERLGTKIEDLRTSIAQNMFVQQEEVATISEEEYNALSDEEKQNWERIEEGLGGAVLGGVAGGLAAGPLGAAAGAAAGHVAQKKLQQRSVNNANRKAKMANAKAAYTSAKYEEVELDDENQIEEGLGGAVLGGVAGGLAAGPLGAAAGAAAGHVAQKKLQQHAVNKSVRKAKMANADAAYKQAKYS